MPEAFEQRLGPDAYGFTLEVDSYDRGVVERLLHAVYRELEYIQRDADRDRGGWLRGGSIVDRFWPVRATLPLRGVLHTRRGIFETPALRAVEEGEIRAYQVEPLCGREFTVQGGFGGHVFVDGKDECMCGGESLWWPR